MSFDSDWAARSAGGDLGIEGFNDTSFLDFRTNPPAGGYQIYRDTSMKKSGDSSMRIDILTNTGANTAGDWTWPFGPRANGTTTYYQYAFRFDSNAMNLTWGAHGTGWKWPLLYGGTPTDNEVSPGGNFENGHLRGSTGGGSSGLYTQGSNPFVFGPANGTEFQQQGDSFTPRTGHWWQYPGTGSGDGILAPAENLWHTMYLKIVMNGTSTTVQAWHATDGSGYKQWLNITGMDAWGTTPSQSTVLGTGYCTNKPDTWAHATASLWMDELIVSSSPIAAPNSANGGGGSSIPYLAPRNLYVMP